MMSCFNQTIYLQSKPVMAVQRLSGSAVRRKHVKKTLEQEITTRRNSRKCESAVIACWEMVGSQRGSAAADWLQTGCRVMTHMAMLLHLQRLPKHGNTLPEKAEGTLMGGQRNVYFATHFPLRGELIKHH